MPSTTRMEELIQSFCAQATGGLSWLLWPEAEDRALRGRNLSAVFRTLYRQGRKLRFLSCAQPWRVENQCDKSTLRKSSGCSSGQTLQKLFFSHSLNYQLNSPIVCPFFRGNSILRATGAEVVRFFRVGKPGGDSRG